MGAAQFLKTRVSSETKARVHALAEQQLITESIWLKRLVTAALRDAPGDEAGQAPSERAGSRTLRNAVLEADAEEAPGMRVCIRLRPDDRLLLRERAAARGMPSATYVSVLLRAHLRHLAPLPKEELVMMKRSVAELGAIGRNLNQIARAANSGGRLAGPAREDLRAILKVCEALRDNTKGLIKASARAWEVGHADGER
jgi:predicted DNA binding CopG/RHH family protein